jgi:hypothetical protein
LSTNMIEQPLMTDIVEATFYVAHQYPGRVAVAECRETSPDCIRSTARLPEPVRRMVRSGLRYRIKRQQVQGLHGPVTHRGDPERSEFAIGFGDGFAVAAAGDTRVPLTTLLLPVSSGVNPRVHCRHQGVFVPSFSVTRRAASNLPLAERISRCGKAFALFHLLCCTAFTIRAWSRPTSPSIVAQLRVSHVRFWPKAAPACAVIC